MTKAELRTKYKDKRARLSSKEIEDASLAIANNLVSMNIWNYTTYHIFLTIQSKYEVNTEYLLHILYGKDKTVLVPKSDFKTNQLTHVLLQENTKLLTSQYGITEPIDGIEVSENKIDVVFIPLLAFDLAGNRLGYGKGFYDRFLSKCRKNCVFIGLSFFEAEHSISAENQDIPLDFCVTPNKIYSF